MRGRDPQHGAKLRLGPGDLAIDVGEERRGTGLLEFGAAGREFEPWEDADGEWLNLARSAARTLARVPAADAGKV